MDGLCIDMYYIETSLYWTCISLRSLIVSVKLGCVIPLRVLVEVDITRKRETGYSMLLVMTP
jgi:hypothetical protein